MLERIEQKFAVGLFVGKLFMKYDRYSLKGENDKPRCTGKC